MSGAIRTMATQMPTITGARRACGRSVSGVNAYVWSPGNTGHVSAFAIAPIPVFTKLHTSRPKEASQ
jgi:hypothetical protein